MDEVRIWLDDIRPAPPGYTPCYSVNEAIYTIKVEEELGNKISLLDLDHDLGDFAFDGGDAIKLLDRLEEQGRYYPIKIHTMNPVGRQNMQVVADRLRRFKK